MEPDEDVTLADFTGPTDDEGGGQYEQYISPDAPDHDPFTQYPDDARLAADSDDEEPDAIVATVSASLAHNLDVRRQKAKSCWSGVSVGWIGDAAHQSECSDHNPDAGHVVHAIDVMVTGSRAEAVVSEALAHHDDLQYVIHNRTIWSVTVGWQARKYTGSDPHTNHVHLSGKHGSSRKNSATCTGYDTTAEKASPAFNICPAPKPPAPKPPAPSGGHQPGTRTLKEASPIMSGADVKFVQQFIGSKRAGAADGKFGPNTAKGVRWYQGMRGIHVDGQVGPQTWGQMGVKWHG